MSTALIALWLACLHDLSSSPKPAVPCSLMAGRVVPVAKSCAPRSVQGYATSFTVRRQILSKRCGYILEHTAQDRVQTALEHLQRGKFHTLTRQPVPEHGHPDS